MDANSWPQGLYCAERGRVGLSVTCDGRQGWLLRRLQGGVVFELTGRRPTQILYRPWESATHAAQPGPDNERLGQTLRSAGIECWF